MNLLGVLFVVLLLELTQNAYGSYQFELPERVKSQGKVTLDYKSAAEIMKHQLTFSETIDSKSQRCKLSIGYVSYEPTIYFASSDVSAISESGGVCKLVNHPSSLAPELSWFTEKIMGAVDTKPALNKYPYLIGPSGLLLILNGMANYTKFVTEGQVNHRNMICDLWTREFTSHDGKLRYKSEVYLIVPSNSTGASISNLDRDRLGKQRAFDRGYTIRVTVTSNPEIQVGFTASFTIDMYDESFFDVADKKANRFEDEFNLPMSSGCSQFLPVSNKFKLHSRSFSMSLRQTSSYKSLMLAYDHFGYLRLENPGKSVSIWDIDNSLLYFIGTNATKSLNNVAQFNGLKVKSCSILQLASDKEYPAAIKPYEKVQLSLMSFLGAERLSYMGRSVSRDLPCRIYETIVAKPPMIFASSRDSTYEKLDPNKIDYIVQFHLIRGANKLGHDLDDEIDFWPTQISLFQRDKSKTYEAVEFLDSIEVDEFHWSLDGWSKRRGELFMVSECFEEDNEFRQLELELKFDRIHNGAPQEEDLVLVDHNKFQLEYTLINSVSHFLNISRMNTIEYELEFGRHQMDLSMTIADRLGDRSLDLLMRGFVADNECIQANECTNLEDMSEADCVAIGSLISGSFMIAHCPSRETPQQYFRAKCMVFHGFHTPNVSNSTTSGTDSQQPACQVYMLRILAAPKKVTDSLDRVASSLRGYLPELELEHDRQGGTLKGKVAHYNVIQTPRTYELHHHKFVVGDEISLTKSFNSIEMKNQADCSRLCDLDVECKSYSYCRLTQDKPSECIVSQVDMRDSSIQKQLLDHEPIMVGSNQTLLNLKTEGGQQFQLEVSTACDIFERDYLSIYSRSMETMRLSQLVTRQLPPAPSTLDCAREAINAERRKADYHSAMFAYCGQTRTCLVDESLVDQIIASTGSGLAMDDSADEIICSIYRRKYHTYFHVSPQILVPNPSQQVELNFKSIEECARACWIEFGQVCASFDYCSSTGGCSLNKIGLNHKPYDGNLELTTQPNCLHYERDMKLDELRRENLVSRHQILSKYSEEQRSSSGSLMLSALFYLGLVAAFMFGLQSADPLTKRLHISVTHLGLRLRSQSVASASGGRFAKRLARFNMAANRQDNENYDFANDDEEANTQTTTSADSTAPHCTSNGNIRMNVIRRNL